jgi:signal transduction histidine kinase
MIYFKVIDNGKGIPKKKKGKMFTDFFSTKGREGTGLGLMVIQKVIQQHGGNITFRSKAGKGTTFIATIPTTLKP